MRQDWIQSPNSNNIPTLYPLNEGGPACLFSIFWGQMLQSKKLILVVEDDQYIGEAMQELLDIENYESHLSVNGREAIEYLHSTERLPDLILLDLMMPVMDGMAFRDAQLKDSRISKIPTIIMSADGHISERQEKAHTLSYVKKPINVDELISKVREYSH